MTPREKELVNVIRDLANRTLRHIASEIDPTTNRATLHAMRKDIKTRCHVALRVAQWEENKEKGEQ